MGVYSVSASAWRCWLPSSFHTEKKHKCSWCSWSLLTCRSEYDSHFLPAPHPYVWRNYCQLMEEAVVRHTTFQHCVKIADFAPRRYWWLVGLFFQEKTVPIPEKLNEWAPRPPPEFVRDVMGNNTILQITMGSATLNLEKCLIEKARGGFLLLLILLEKRGMKCALKVAFSSFLWYLGSAFRLVRMQSERYLWHCGTWAACNEISCCSGDDK